MANEFPLSLIIRAVDRVTAPMRAINERIARVTAPARQLGNAFSALSREAGFPKLLEGFAGVGKSVGKLGAEVAGLGKTMVVGLGAATVASLAFLKSSTAVGDAMDELSQRTGFGVQTLSEWQFVAMRAGVANEEFGNSMDFLSRQIGDLRRGSGSLYTFLEDVSPKLLAQVKATKSSEAAFGLLIEGLQKIEDPARRSAFAMAAFGRTGQKMASIGTMTADEIAKLREEFVRLAGNQEEYARQSAAFNDLWDDTALAIMGVRNAALAELLPVLTTLGRTLTEFIVGNRELVGAWARGFAAELPGRVAALVGHVQSLYEAFRPILEIMGSLVDTFGAGNVALGLIGLKIASTLIPAVFGLAVALKTLGVAMALTPIGLFLGLVAALAGAAYMIYRNWEPISDFFSGLWSGVVAVFEGAWAAIGAIVDRIAGAISTVVNTIARVGNFMGDLGSAAGAAIIGRPALNAAGAAPTPAGAGGGETRVVVDFNNMPPGTRVKADPQGSAPLDLSMGYSMAGAMP